MGFTDYQSAFSVRSTSVEENARARVVKKIDENRREVETLNLKRDKRKASRQAPRGGVATTPCDQP